MFLGLVSSTCNCGALVRLTFSVYKYKTWKTNGRDNRPSLSLSHHRIPCLLLIKPARSVEQYLISNSTAYFIFLFQFCHKSPRYTGVNGQVTSLYCSNVCAKRAGAPLPNPDSLVKRSKNLDLPQLLAQEAQLEKAKDDPVEPQSIISLVKSGLWKVSEKL